MHRHAREFVDELLIIHEDDARAYRVAWHRSPACCRGGNQPPHLRLHCLNRERLGQKSPWRTWVRLVVLTQGIQPLLKCRNHEDGQLGMRIGETLRQFLTAQSRMREIGDEQVRRRLLHDLPRFVAMLTCDDFSIWELRLNDGPDGFPHFLQVVQEDDAEWAASAAGCPSSGSWLILVR